MIYRNLASLGFIFLDVQSALCLFLSLLVWSIGQGGTEACTLTLQRHCPTAELGSKRAVVRTRTKAHPMQTAARIADGSSHRQHGTLDRVVTRAHELTDKQRSNLRESLRTTVRPVERPTAQLFVVVLIWML